MSDLLDNETRRVVSRWRTWTRQQWSRALFDFYFQVGDDDAPVTRIATNEEDLRAAVGDAEATGEELRSAFIAALCCTHNQLRDRLASRTYLTSLGTWQGDEPPGFFGYLALTCMVAGSAEVETMRVGDFRRRLNTLMQHPLTPRQNLEDLPSLWSALAEWLDDQRTRGAPYRELVLPGVDWRRLIGYSIRLAFPLAADQLRLVRLFAANELDANPPIAQVIEIVSGAQRQFGLEFQSAFADLRVKYGHHDPAFARDTLWSAIRHAIDESQSIGKAASPRALKLLLVESDDGDTELMLTAAEPFHCLSGMEFIPSHIIAAEYHLVVTAPIHGIQRSWRAAELLLLGALSDLYVIKKSFLQTTVDQGVLLFTPGKSGFSELVSSTPPEGTVHVVVRDDLLEAVKGLIRPSRRPASRPIMIAGWSEIRPFDVSDLVVEQGLPSALNGVRALEPRSVGPAVRLQGGARIEGAYLGFLDALPAVRIAGADHVVLFEVDSAGRMGERLRLVRGDEEDLWRFPASESEPFDGVFVLVALAHEKALARRSVRFALRVLPAPYTPPEPLHDWLIEGPGGCMNEATEDSRTMVVAANTESGSDLLSNASGPFSGATRRSAWSSIPVASEAHSGALGDESSSASVDDLPELDRFVEVLAARSLSRKGIPEGELLERIASLLKVEGYRERWDVVRGWLETANFDCLANRRWNERVYFARDPRLEIVQRRGDWLATLTGLAPQYSRSRMRKAAEQFATSVRATRALSPHVPAPLQWIFPSREAAIASAVRAAIPSVETSAEMPALVPLAKLALGSSEAPRGYQLVGKWDWASGRRRDIATAGRFTTTIGSENVSIDIVARDDRVDCYCVLANGRVRWATESRNWALLIGYALAGIPVFEIARPVHLSRSITGQVYLPIGLARWVVIGSGVAPGPVMNGAPAGSYVYQFDSSRVLTDALGRLRGWDDIASQAQAIAPTNNRWLRIQHAAGHLATGRTLPLGRYGDAFRVVSAAQAHATPFLSPELVMRLQALRKK